MLKIYSAIRIYHRPLRHLIKKTTPWHWNSKHQKAFNKLKQSLLLSETLAYFNPSAETEVITDASPVGLGAVIAQRQPDGNFRPISYASRALTPVEQRYSQIERESLAILFGVERFRMYLYGMKIIVRTDHKPLVNLFSPTAKPPPRIERWVMRLMAYDFKVFYQPGSQNSADYLSRSNPLQKKVHREKMAEEYIHHITMQALPRSLTLKQIAAATIKDPLLHALKIAVSKSWAGYTPSAKFYPMRHDITVYQDVLLYKQRILIPKSLRNLTLELAHEGHQGVVRTKQRLRAKVWWPKMNKDAEQYVEKYHSCQVVGKMPNPDPVTMTKIPDAAWILVGCDLCGPFPTGEHLLVCVDYYSRYPEVVILRKVSAQMITTKLRKLFCRYGAPEELITDNGPQFRDNQDFKALLQEFNVKHRRVTPYHPAANGEVECFNRNLKKCIQTAIADNRNWRKTLENYLLSYRNTEHRITGSTPAELMFGRKLRDKLPFVSNTVAKHNSTRDAIT